ncbi:MAG: hypothetical protein LBS85_08235 [Clostridiales Family XIII bacterium]|nr:hypothetical protein [Clostridiales Family XIII bacterium]
MTKQTKWKTVLGLVLVVLAVGTLLFWEAEGREALLMEDVLIAKDEIKAGAALLPEMFRTVGVPGEAVAEEACRPDFEAELPNMVAAEAIHAGAQLTEKQLLSKDALPRSDTSCFVLRNNWLFMCTSSLRRGDRVDILSQDGKTRFGQFDVAYVKDSEGREVTDAGAGLRGFGETDGERVNPSAPVHHIEIRCEWDDYEKIKSYCEKDASAALILVRREVRQ